MKNNSSTHPNTIGKKILDELGRSISQRWTASGGLLPKDRKAIDQIKADYRASKRGGSS